MAVTCELGRVLLVVPAYDEQECLGGTLQELRFALPDVDVVVVDDGSRDATAAVAQAAGVPVLRLPFNLGVGGAMRAGFLHAQRNGYRVVVQVDADGQHDPTEVPALLAALVREGSDVVIGARFDGTGDYHVTGPRRWAMRLLASVVSRRTGVRLTDVTSGFRASGPRAVDLFAASYPADYLGDTVESLLLANAARLRVSQVPVAMRTRRGGVASTRPFRSTLLLLRALLVLAVFLARRPATGRRRRGLHPAAGRAETRSMGITSADT